MKYYMAGIKGAGMSALALLLTDLGYDVIGYDDATEHRFTEDKLIERGNLDLMNIHYFLKQLRWGLKYMNIKKCLEN